MFSKIAQIDYIIDKFLFHYYKPYLKIRRTHLNLKLNFNKTFPDWKVWYPSWFTELISCELGIQFELYFLKPADEIEGKTKNLNYWRFTYCRQKNKRSFNLRRNICFQVEMVVHFVLLKRDPWFIMLHIM